MSNTFPSRQMTVTFTHPTLGDALFAPLVEQAMREIATLGIDSLDAVGNEEGGTTSTITCRSGVVVEVRSKSRGG